MISRRQFFKLSAAAGASVILPQFSPLVGPGGSVARAAPAPSVTFYVDPLPVPPVLSPGTNPTYPGADYYEITAEQGAHQFHSSLPVGQAWGYGGAGYLGPTIVAQRGKPVVVKFTNNLPSTHLLHNAIDPSIFQGMTFASESRMVPHLHGGFTLPQFDGHPNAYFGPDPNGEVGMTYATLDPSLPKNTAVYQYSNRQPATLLWYHDHAMYTTRLNAYAGLAAAYIIRDEFDTGIPGQGLNLPKGKFEVPLVIQDKDIASTGMMTYPEEGVSPLHPVWVPEFFGGAPVINGIIAPYLDVQRRRYRFRLLNGSQARFYNLAFRIGKSTRLAPFTVIGMEQGLLPAPINAQQLLIAPGERADIIVDFAPYDGKVLTLVNDAPAPYPSGGEEAITEMMQFRVGTKAVTDPTTPPQLLSLPAVPRLTRTPGTPKREIILKEVEEPTTANPAEVLLNSKHFADPVEENPKVGTTEVWQFINATVDAHPMHLHLVHFQVLNRQPFDNLRYAGDWDTYAAGQGPRPVLADYLTGPAQPPAPIEMGWKDTVKAYPGYVTRIISRFNVPPSTQLPADYVYHCHILEHEENEMMRPFQVVP